MSEGLVLPLCFLTLDLYFPTRQSSRSLIPGCIGKTRLPLPEFYQGGVVKQCEILPRFIIFDTSRIWRALVSKWSKISEILNIRLQRYDYHYDYDYDAITIALIFLQGAGQKVPNLARIWTLRWSSYVCCDDYVGNVDRVRVGVDIQRRVGAGESPSRRGVLAAPASRLRPARRVRAKTETASATHRHRHGQ